MYVFLPREQMIAYFRLTTMITAATRSQNNSKISLIGQSLTKKTFSWTFYWLWINLIKFFHVTARPRWQRQREHVDRAFLYISLPSFDDFDTQLPNFTFHGRRSVSFAAARAGVAQTRKHVNLRKRLFLSFPELRYSALEFNSRKKFRN